MGELFYMLLDAGMAAVLLLPIFLILGKTVFRNWGRTVCYFVLAVYLCEMYALVGLPNAYYIRFEMNINLVPFRHLFSYLWNNLLNVLLFMPLGFFLPVLFRRYQKFYRTVLFGFLLSLLIELLQIFTFRATDVNDLMTNTLGCVIGWCVGKLLLKLFPSILPTQRTRDLYIVCGVSLAVMFFLHPILSNIVYAPPYLYFSF